MYRKTYALIDCNVIEDNVKAIIKEYSSYKYYFGVVKANAYGHGSILIAEKLSEIGINDFAVATLDEGLEVRKRYSDVPVLVLEPVSASDAEVASKNNITITIDNKDIFDIAMNKNYDLIVGNDICIKYMEEKTNENVGTIGIVGCITNNFCMCGK